MIIQDLVIKTVQGRTLIDHLSFTINKGDRIALIGEEGNGKSTLLKALYNPQAIRNYAVISGTIDYQNKTVGYLPQLLDQTWQQCSIIEYLLKNDSEEEIEIEAYNELQDYQEILAKMNLREDFLSRNQTMGSLSGGEKIKVQLAKIIQKQPDILFLDEPTNDLDIDTLEWLEEFLLHLNAAVLFISHDETLLENVANKIMHLEQLKRKTEVLIRQETLGYREYIEKRGYLIQRQNMIAKKEKQEHNKAMTRWREIYQKVDHQLNAVSRQDPHTAQMLKKKMRNVQSVKKRLDEKDLTEKIEPEEAINIFFSGEKSVENNQVVLDFQSEELRNDSGVLASNINLFIKGPQKVMIIGKNGIGKTTLLKEILQEFEKQIKFSYHYMPQNYEEYMPMEENVVSWLAQSAKKEKLTKARSLLGNLKFTTEEMEKNLADLSGGQRAKAYLARFICEEVEVLLLDEPTRNLSPLSNPVIRELLSSFNGAILAITHDRLLIEEVGTQVYELTEDGLVELKRI